MYFQFQILNTSIIFSTLNIIAIINIVALCVFLCVRKNNSLPNYILALVFVIPGLYLVDNLLIVNNTLYKIPYAFFVVQIIANLFPIAVYYYVHLLLTDKKKYHPLLLFGSIVLLTYIIGLSVFFSLLSDAEKSTYLQALNSEHYPISMNTYNVFFYAWQMVYIVVLNIEIKKYQINVENNLSSIDSVKLHFAKQFMRLLAILNFGLVVFYVVLPVPMVDYAVLPVILTIIYLFIIYYSIKNKAVFSEASYSQLILENQFVINSESNNNKALFEETALETIEIEVDEKTQLIITKIEKALYEDKLYKLPEFKLLALAENIQEQSYLTSQVLNKHFKKSFFDIVNELRIQDAELRLKNFDPKKDKIEAVAYEVGFNSRAAFYRSFKKITGKNPSELVPLS